MRAPANPWRTIAKQLTCARCGEVVAEATYRPWSAALRLAPVSSASVTPASGATQLAIAKERLAAAAPGPAADEAAAALAYVERNLGEVMYELVCRQGHRIVRTAPEIRRALRRAGGRWASLA